MRYISSWAIRNPIIPVVIFLMFTIMGLGSFFKLPINSNPDIELPMFSVDVSMPGAAPSEIQNQITVKIEGALTGIEGVKKMTSTAQTSHSNTMVELQIGADISKAVDDARAAVSQVRSDLPGGIMEPIVSRIDFNDQDPIGAYVITAPSMTTEQLSWFIDNDVTRAFLAVKGVSRIERWGGQNRQISVDIDPNKLNAFGGSVSDVSYALRAQNIDVPGGLAETGAGQQTIRTMGAVKTVTDLQNIPVTLSNGRVLKLSDIADVRDGGQDITSISRFNGQPVTMFQVLHTKSASTLRTYRALQEEIKKFVKDHPGVEIIPAFTPPDYVQDDYDSSLKSMLEGALLATLVVAMFLGGWRTIFIETAIAAVVIFGGAFLLEHFAHMHFSEVALLALLTVCVAVISFLKREGRATFLAAMAIPLSTIPTFYVMSLLGFTLNGVTLLALGLVAGILVDDAIVEIENIERHIHMGKTPFQAALEAADEIGLAVVATTFTIVAVFVPVSFMTGIIGQFFKSFGLTVAVAVLFSLAVARMITPLLAAYLLAPKDENKVEKPNPVAEWYYGVLEWSLKNRWKTFGLGIALFFAAIVSMVFTPKTTMPQLDQGFVNISIDLPPGLTPNEADARARAVGDLILNEPGTDKVIQWTKGDLTGAGFFITLVERKDRDMTQKEYEDDLREKIALVPGIRSQFGGGWGSSGVEINLVSSNSDELEKAASRVVAEMRKIPWALDLRSTADLTKPELHITPKREEAARLGVSVSDIATATRIATSGDIEMNLPKFNSGERQIPIMVRLARENRADIETIKSLRVPTAAGVSVPLSSVADVEYGGGQARISRQDRERVITIKASLGKGEDGKQLQLGQAIEKLKKYDWYNNPGPGVHIKESGDAEDLADMMSQFTGAIGMGVLLIFAVLVLLFKDFLQPITIVSVIFLAPAGAFFGLFLTQEPLSLPVFIGLLMLIGIATKNSILLVDFAVESINHGMPRYEAILDAAKKRSRPIIMTTIAMVAGMVPNALTTAGPGAFRHGMAVAVIGGLIVSTALSLVFVPAVYTLVDDFDHWISKFFRGVGSTSQEDREIALKEEAARRAKRLTQAE